MKHHLAETLGRIVRFATVACVALAVCYVSFDDRFVGGMGSGRTEYCSYFSGWPLVCSDLQTVAPMFPDSPGSIQYSEKRTIYPMAMAFNVAALLTIVVCTFYVARRLRSATKFRQFSLSALFILVNVVAILTAILRYEFYASEAMILEYLVSAPSSYHPITSNYPWWIFVPILYGIACVAIVCCLISSRVLRSLALWLPSSSHGLPAS